jgi:hypothetical protein
MSGRGWHKDKRIGHAIAFLLQCPQAHVPEAMLACKFAPAESKNPAKQMAAHQAYTKAIGAQTRAPPPVSVDAMTIESSVLPLTDLTATAAQSEMHGEEGNVIVFARPKPKQIRNMASEMQQWQSINSIQANMPSALSRGQQVGMPERMARHCGGRSELLR